jgi:hypothetical protein
MDPVTFWIIFLIARAIHVAAISWQTIRSWITTPRANASYGTLIKKCLESGDYVVIGGIFDGNGAEIAKESWQSKTLDDELKQKFGRRNKITVSI